MLMLGYCFESLLLADFWGLCPLLIVFFVVFLLFLVVSVLVLFLGYCPGPHSVLLCNRGNPKP